MKARVVGSVVLALAVAFGTAGCGFITPQSTTKHYDASDGVSGNVGQIDVRNAMIITNATNGTVGNLVVTLVNNDSKSHSLAIEPGADPTKTQHVTVEPGQVLLLGEKPHSATGNNVLIPNFSARPGSLFPVFFQYADATGVELKVPVLDGHITEYSKLVPPEILPAAK